jgi:hypothetical protein
VAIGFLSEVKPRGIRLEISMNECHTPDDRPVGVKSGYELLCQSEHPPGVGHPMAGSISSNNRPNRVGNSRKRGLLMLWTARVRAGHRFDIRGCVL